MANRIPGYRLDAMKHVTIMQMVDNKFGPIPVKGSRPRGTGGGFYKEAGDSCVKIFNHRPGQGTLRGWKDQALEIQTKLKLAPVTSTTKEPADSLKLRRLGSQKLQSQMSDKQRALVSSMKGWAKHSPLTEDQQGILNSMYTQFYGK